MDEIKYNNKQDTTPGERGVTRRYLAVTLLIFAMVYGVYSIVMNKTMNEVYISTMIATGGGLLGIGRFGKTI